MFQGQAPAPATGQWGGMATGAFPQQPVGTGVFQQQQYMVSFDELFLIDIKIDILKLECLVPKPFYYFGIVQDFILNLNNTHF